MKRLWEFMLKQSISQKRGRTIYLRGKVIHLERGDLCFSAKDISKLSKVPYPRARRIIRVFKKNGVIRKVDHGIGRCARSTYRLTDFPLFKILLMGNDHARAI